MRFSKKISSAIQLEIEFPPFEESYKLSPIMEQYYSLKDKHPDAILLFRCGLFYEMYDSDAVRASEILGIKKTKHNKRKDRNGKALQFASFPYDYLDNHLPKLIRAGHRVAICDEIKRESGC